MQATHVHGLTYHSIRLRNEEKNNGNDKSNPVVKEDIDVICNYKQDARDQYLEHHCSFLEKVPNDQSIMMDFLERLVTARNNSEPKSDALELFLKSMISLLEPNGIIFLYSGKMKGTCM